MRFWIGGALLGLAACATPPNTTSGPALELDFNWDGFERCTNVSPRIVVAGMPAGTKRLRFEMVDLEVVMSSQGGGEVANDGSGIIPKGALKTFTGPCPPYDQHRYEMRVSALAADGSVLARGAEIRVFPTKAPPNLVPNRAPRSR